MTQNKYPCTKCGKMNAKELSRPEGKYKIRSIIFECLKCGFMWSEEIKKKEIAR